MHASLFDNIDSLDALFKDDRYPDKPTLSGVFYNLDTPTNLGENYALRIWTYIVAPATGDFTFYGSGDDEMLVRLSNDTNEANKDMIIKSEWSSRYQYDK